MISEVKHPDELQHGLGPIWASTRVANPDFAVCGTVTFRNSGAFLTAAHTWKETLFSPIIRPALRASLAHARHGQFRELCDLDRDLSSRLPAAVHAGSLRAGRRLGLHCAGLRGDRLLPRLADAIGQDATLGHLAIVFAARCAAFSIHDHVAIGAYLFQEMCAGAPTAPVKEVCSFVAGCMEGNPSLELRAA